MPLVMAITQSSSQAMAIASVTRKRGRHVSHSVYFAGRGVPGRRSGRGAGLPAGRRRRAAVSPLNPEAPRPAVAQLAAAAPVAIDSQLFRAPEPGRPAALVPMYASFVTLQALDFVSTTRALSSPNAYEANP